MADFREMTGCFECVSRPWTGRRPWHFISLINALVGLPQVMEEKVYALRVASEIGSFHRPGSRPSALTPSMASNCSIRRPQSRNDV